MMAASMGPPALSRFSLRVQLYSSNAYGPSDKPIHCFRVVTRPDVTIREFCEEACRIHELNYGVPIAIKKCQDEEQFDVTQSEVVGHLFGSRDMIRVIQASTVSIRDSVPPDSALRYDPALSSQQGKKRNRQSSVRPNGVGTLSPAFGSNKRLKLSDNNPDDPIPSRERDFESSRAERNATIIPNSQQSTGRSGDIRDEIRDSISPPHPALLPSANIEKRPTNQYYDKLASAKKANAQSAIAQGSPSKPTASIAPIKPRTASSLIERATEPGTPVSTGATSPLSADKQLPPRHRSTSTNKSKLSGPPKVNGKPSPKPRNEKIIYDVDEIDSDSASVSSILDKTKASLKLGKSPLNGVSPQGMRDKFNTPPNGSRRNSRGSDLVSAPELLLTPSSKQREKQQQSNDAKESRVTADEAAEQEFLETSEQKWREADEARKADRAKSVELARLKKEEQEKAAAEKRASTAARLEKERVEKVERAKKAEEEWQAEQKHAEEANIKKAKEQAEKVEREKKARAAKAKAEKAKAEKVERAKRAEEERQAEQKRAEEVKVKKAKEQAENLEREKARTEKQKQEEERIQNEKAKAKAEAETERRRREERRKRDAEVAATTAEAWEKSKRKTQTQPSLERKLSSASAESSISRSHTGSSPASKPQSSTPFIPSGRKSALKSSQATISSPMSRDSPETRRVSFNPVTVTTPLRSNSGRRSSSLQQKVPPEKQSQTPILPPGVKVSKQSTSITPPVSTTPKVTVNGQTPSRSNETVRPSIVKGKSKSVETPAALDSRRDTLSEGSDSDQNAPANILNSAVRPNSLTPKAAPKPELAPKEKVDEYQDEDVEMEIGSRQSTPPETRSPVIFNHHPAALARVPTLELSKHTGAAEDEAETQSLSDASSIDDGSDDSSEGQDEDDDENIDEDEEMHDVESEGDDASTVKGPQSSLDLPRPQSSSQRSVSRGKLESHTGRFSPGVSDKGSTTQDAIDNQLTSSIFEASASSPSSKMRNTNKAAPSSSLPSSRKPKFNIGASLQDLNTAQGMVSQSSVTIRGPVNGTRTLKSLEDEESGSQSESDSADDSDSDSNDEGTTSKAFDAQLSQAQSVPLPESDDDSSDDSDSEDEYKEKMRKKLVTDLARMAQKNASQKGSPSTSSQPDSSKDKSRIAGRDIAKAEKKKREQKYLNSYSFSQVK